MTEKKKKRDRLLGLRVFVHSAGGGMTTISIPHRQVRELRRLAGFDEQVLTTCAREESKRAKPIAGQPWSAVVVAGMFKQLSASQRLQMSMQVGGPFVDEGLPEPLERHIAHPEKISQ